MLDRKPRRATVRRRGRRKGQVMVLFVLLLPVMVGFLALSIGASVELNTRATLDQAALTAAIAASSDACMSSPYAFDVYECKSGSYSSIESLPGQLPEPPFTDISGQTSTYGDSGATTCITYSCGNGSNGPATLTGSITLSGDMQYTTLIINGAHINTHGYRILAQTSITVNGGKIYDDGGNASGTTGGAGAGGRTSSSGSSAGPWSPTGSVGGGYTGSAAATVNGNPGNPSNPSTSTDSLGGGGGSGDFPCAPSAGSGTTGWDDSSGVPNTNYFPVNPSVQLGGAGGGSGCTSSNPSGNFGGGGGGGGGVVVLAAPSISFPGGGTLEATGGNGANGTLRPGRGNGGGGGGGGGGAALLFSGNNPTGFASNFAGGALGTNVQGITMGTHGGHGGSAGGAGAGAIWVPNALSGSTSIAPTFHPVNTQCTTATSSTAYCVIVEHDLALKSADAVVKQVLAADYPGFTVVTCPGETSSGTDGSPTTAPTPTTTTPSACAAMVTNDTTIVYQDTVSYWYYSDTDDPPAGGPTAKNDVPTDDLDAGQTLDNAGGGNADPSGDDGGSPPASDPLACPATQQLGRLVTVQIWTHFNTPYGGFLGVNNIGLSANADSYGCGGDL